LIGPLNKYRRDIMKKLVTKTIGTVDQPSFTILKGRHSLKAFNMASKNEGFLNKVRKDELEYGWFRKTKRGHTRSTISDLKAEVYTYVEW
jgi:hypothetical protein